MMTPAQRRRASVVRLFRERDVVAAYDDALILEIRQRMLGPLSVRARRWLETSLTSDVLYSWGYSKVRGRQDEGAS